MSAPREGPARLRAWLRRRERSVAAALIPAAVLVVLGAPYALERSEPLLLRWEDRWVPRVAVGEALVAAGRHDDAAVVLTRLDAEFPAQSVRHRLDKERERLLRALAAAHEGAGRNGRALETYERLVAFDPRNFENHVALADASRRLGGDDPLPHFEAALAINPNHLPSVRAVATIAFEDGAWSAVTAAVERYVNTPLLRRVRFILGDTATDVAVPVDGTSHTVELGLAQPAGWAGLLVVATHGVAFSLDRISLTAPLRTGLAREAAELTLATGGEVRADGMHRDGSGRFRPDSAGASAVVAVQPQVDGIARVTVALRLYKPMDSSLWSMVQTAYRNRLDPAGFERLEARVVVSPSAEHADAVLR